MSCEPQLLDRFGLSVHVSTIMDVDTRTQMVLDPAGLRPGEPGSLPGTCLSALSKQGLHSTPPKHWCNAPAVEPLSSRPAASSWSLQDPVAFCEAAAQEQAALRDKLEGATARLEAVETPDDIDGCRSPRSAPCWRWTAFGGTSR